MSEENKSFWLGFWLFGSLALLPLFVGLKAISLHYFTSGYTQGKQEGYRIGYVTALVNQSKGNDHEFKLVEQKNGELVWKNSGEVAKLKEVAE